MSDKQSTEPQCGTLAVKRVEFGPLWEHVAAGVVDVLNLREGTSAMPIFEDIYTLCTANPREFSVEVYAALKSLLAHHVTELIRPLLPNTPQCSEQQQQQSQQPMLDETLALCVLSKYLNLWKRFAIASAYLDNMFRYLNINWILKQRKEAAKQSLTGMSQRQAKPETIMDLLYPGRRRVSGCVRPHSHSPSEAGDNTAAQGQAPRRPRSRGKTSVPTGIAPPPPLVAPPSVFPSSAVAPTRSLGSQRPQSPSLFGTRSRLTTEEVYNVEVLCKRVWAEYGYAPLREVLRFAAAAQINKLRVRAFDMVSGNDATPPHAIPALSSAQGSSSDSADSGKLSSVVELFQSLKQIGMAVTPNDPLAVYRVEGEGMYFEQLRKMFESQSGQFISAQGVCAYLTAANKMTREELSLGKALLDRTSMGPLASLLYDCLVVEHVSVIQGECKTLLSSNNTNAMRALYELIDMTALRDGTFGVQQAKPREGFRLETQGTNTLLDEEHKQSAIDAVAKTVEEWMTQDSLAQLSHEFNTLTHGSGRCHSTAVVVRYTEFLLEVHKRLVDLVHQCFDDHPRFVTALDCSARVYVNEGDCNCGSQAKKAASEQDAVSMKEAPVPDVASRSQIPEILVRYMDFCLFTGMRNRQQSLQLSKHSKILSRNGFDRAEVENLLGDVVTLFRFIHEKDMFLHFYGQFLSRRLVSENTLSEEVESTIIRALRQSCGVEAVTRMMSMCMDIEKGHELNKDFGDYCSRHELNHPHVGRFSTQVLTNGFWPIAQSTGNSSILLSTEACLLVQASSVIGPHLPAEVHQCESDFAMFYGELHYGRKLRWCYAHTRAVLRTNYCRQTFELELSNIIQLFILLSFNNLAAGESLSLRTLAEIGVSEKLLESYATQLCKLRLLTKNEDGTYALNKSFSSTKRKLSLPWWLGRSEHSERRESGEQQSTQNKSVGEDGDDDQGRMTEAESMETLRKLNQERIMHLQSVIMRVMKSKKTANQTELAASVLEACRNTVIMFHDTLFRTSLDILVDKEYLSRSSDKPPVYVYIP